jgi:hypothetical protein
VGPELRLSSALAAGRNAITASIASQQLGCARPFDRLTNVICIKDAMFLRSSAKRKKKRCNQSFDSRMTRMNANSRNFYFDFAKLSECDTSRCRFGSKQAKTKSVRGRPALQKHFAKSSLIRAK